MRVAVGLGEVPGERTIVCWDRPVEEKETMTESRQDADSEKDGEPEVTGASTDGGNDKDPEVALPPDTEEETKKFYVGFSNRAKGDRGRQQPSPLSIRNVAVRPVPDDLVAKIETLQEADWQQAALDDMDDDPQRKALFQEYLEQCAKAKARALKFGLDYTAPAPPAAFLPWSQARRLQANPKEGFITGLDLMDPEEKAKVEKRKARFGEAVLESTEEKLPLEQAWDNEELVRPFRVDPDPSLWKTPGPVRFFGPPPTWVPEKVHVFSIDWAAFKQIRTNDLMQHFSVCGPTYVEWLGDLSCNIHFPDPFSAARALEHMSQALDKDLGNKGWRLGHQLVRKVANDRYGRRGTTARLLLRSATSQDVLEQRPSTWPKPPPGFSTKRVLGPGSDFPQKQGPEKRQKSAEEMMNRGLSARRRGAGGFSMEELEAERAAKRARTTQDEGT